MLSHLHTKHAREVQSLISHNHPSMQHTEEHQHNKKAHDPPMAASFFLHMGTPQLQQFVLNTI